MRTGFTDALLVISVLCCWVACVGLARLRSPLGRLHCASLVNAVAVPAMVAAAFVADGPSQRAWKFLIAAIVALVSGAAGAHAAGRAVVERDGAE